MSAERDVTRSVRSWLKEDRHEDADRVLDMVLDQLDTTPQRRAGWLARRLPFMNNPTVRYGIAAAVVALMAIVGFRLLSAPDDSVGPPGPSGTGTPTATSSPIPLLSNQGESLLRPGTYLIDDPFPVRVALTVPGGWWHWTVDFVAAGILVETGHPNGSGWGLFFFPSSVRLLADPCDRTQGTLEPQFGGSVDEFVAALQELPRVSVSAPVDIEVDGHPGQLVEVTADSDAASCQAGDVTLWDVEGYDDYAMGLGERLPLRIVDVDGLTLLIVATDYPATSAWEVKNGVPVDPDAHAEHQLELQAIFDSIQINP